jgi:hypothetical protein
VIHDTPLMFCFLFYRDVYFVDGVLVTCVPMTICVCVDYNNLNESPCIPDDGPVGSKHVDEFVRRHGLSGDINQGLLKLH